MPDQLSHAAAAGLPAMIARYQLIILRMVPVLARQGEARCMQCRQSKRYPRVLSCNFKRRLLVALNTDKTGDLCSAYGAGCR